MMAKSISKELCQDKKFKICFLGGMRYSRPLDVTQEKKWSKLTEAGEMYVIGFSTDWKPHSFTQYAHFYLLPQLLLPVLRYLEMFTIGPVVMLWLILKHRVDILVAQSPYEGFVAAVVKTVLGLFGKRVVLIVESHGDFEESLFLQRRVFLPVLYRFLMRQTARFAFWHADILRAVSGSTWQQLKTWAPGKPLLQFPTWTDIDVFLKAGEARKKKDEGLILYAGVLTPLKGIHFLLDAFAEVVKEVPEARLWIVGKEENLEYAKGLKEQTQRLGLEKKVKFLEPVSQKELADYMACACVLVLPSLSEALGRVVFEAMASGTAVIGSRVGGIPEMITDGETGFLIPPGDVKTLAEKLRWMLEHPQQAQKMGQKARKVAQSFFSSEKYIQSYAHLFETARQILETKKRRR